MTKSHLWILLAAMLGAGGGVALRPSFEGATTLQIDPTFKTTRIALFGRGCADGEAEPCWGLEVCGAVYASPEAEEPIAQGCFSEAAPPDDAGIADNLRRKGRAFLRRARADDAGVLGTARPIDRLVAFECQTCPGGYGLEAQDELGSASGELDDLPLAAKKLARDFWARRTAKDAGAQAADVGAVP